MRRRAEATFVTGEYVTPNTESSALVYFVLYTEHLAPHGYALAHQIYS